jgi:hypothetical protein
MYCWRAGRWGKFVGILYSAELKFRTPDASYDGSMDITEGNQEARPLQFGMRLLLAATVVVCVFCWWLYQPPRGYLSESRSREIRAGMTTAEVDSVTQGAIGRGINAGGPPSIGFAVHRPFMEYGAFIVTFDEAGDRVAKVELDWESRIFFGGSYPPPPFRFATWGNLVFALTLGFASWLGWPRQ